MTADSIPRERITAPSRALVATDAVAHNTALMRRSCGVPVMAVVKADGFGLGAERIARAALDGGASELGVASCEEAIALRDAGITVPVLVWLLHEAAPFEETLVRDIRISVPSAGVLERVVLAARRTGVTAEIEIEVETGMQRSGAPRGEWVELFAAARRAEHEGDVRVIGVWTHLAGTAPELYTSPLAALDDALDLARLAGLQPRSHAAASVPATIDPRTRRDIVRLGASLFGIEPVRASPLGLRSSVRWESVVAQVRIAEPGSHVGYGLDVVERRTRLGLVPLGYADGVPRRASPGLALAIAGRRHPLLGAVSMDQIVVDLGDADIAPGERVVLIGDADRGEPTLGEWAELLDTIPQEVLTGLGSRVARAVTPHASKESA